MDDLVQTCRTCLNKEEKLLAISAQIELTYKIKDYFKKYLQLNMSEGDNLPSNICLKCLNKLLYVRKFCIQCQDSENYLRLKLHIPLKSANKSLISDSESIKFERGFENLFIGNFGKPETSTLENKKSHLITEKHEKKEDPSETKEFKNTTCFENQPDFDDATLNENSRGDSASDHFVHYEILEEYAKDTNAVQESKNQLYKCHDCNEDFRFRKNLQFHIKLVHDAKFLNIFKKNKVDHRPLYESTKRFNETAFTCRHCQKKFAFRINYNIHIKRHQNKKYSHESCVCSICGKKFGDKRKLQKHIYRHKIKYSEIYCPVCNKNFKARYHLKIHMNQHTGAKPFSCNICNKNFASPSSLRLHKTLHEGKKIQCHMCDAKLAAKTQLKIHMRMHTNERPYACTQCPKRYKQLCALKVHIATHSGVKSVQCEECSACFYSKNHLLSHKIKIHRPKKFHCNKCSRQFATPFQMKTHLSTAHKIYTRDLSSYKIININVVN